MNIGIFIKKFAKPLKFIRKNRKMAFWVCAIVILVAEGLFFLWQEDKLGSVISFVQPSGPAVPGMILFESSECEHCKKVDTFITNNNVEEKIAFTRFDVVANPSSANLLADKAQTCALPSSHIGIPFFWDGKRCIVGYIDVIQYFREELAKK